MTIRKLGIVGGFALGAAALAFAPLASADDNALSAGDIFSDVHSFQISSANFLFEAAGTLAGVDSADIVQSEGGFDTMSSGGDLTNETFAHFVYGIDPEAAGESSHTGAFNILNGAAVEFDNAFNVLLYAALNDGDLIGSGDLFGSPSVINAALATGDPWSASEAFFNAGMDDVGGYLNIDLSDIFPWPVG